MIRIACILLVFFAACNNKKRVTESSYGFQKADSIGISYDFGDRVSTIYKKDKQLLADIDRVFNGPGTDCNCKEDGYITLHEKDTVTIINFAIGVNQDSCQYFMTEEGGKKKCYKLTYNIGMYLSEKRDFIKP